jgi:hypothetical protein
MMKTETSLELSWEPPIKPNGKITIYVIAYTTNKELPEKDWIQKTEVLTNFFSRFEKYVTNHLTGLTANATYYMKVKAGNKQGYGPYTNAMKVLMVLSNKKIIDEAPSISYKSTSLTSVEVSWRYSLSSLGKPVSYQLLYTKDKDLADPLWYKHEVPVIWALRAERRVVVQLPRLTVNQTYYIKVRAKYKNEDGSWSKTLTIPIKGNCLLKVPISPNSIFSVLILHEVNS